MSSEDSEKMMTELPDGILGPSSATSYTISNKRARQDEDDFARAKKEATGFGLKESVRTIYIPLGLR